MVKLVISRPKIKLLKARNVLYMVWKWRVIAPKSLWNILVTAVCLFFCPSDVQPTILVRSSWFFDTRPPYSGPRTMAKLCRFFSCHGNQSLNDEKIVIFYCSAISKQIFFHIFYMLLEDSFGVKFISKCSWGLEAYIYIKCLWVLSTHIYWFRVTVGYICGCGRPSNLVDIVMYYLNVRR